MLLDEFFHLELEEGHGDLGGGKLAAADDGVLLHFLVGEHVVNSLLGGRERGQRQLGLLIEAVIKVGEFGEHVLGGFAKLRAIFYQTVTTGAARGIDLAGHSVNGAAIFGSQVGGNERTAGAVAFPRG